MATPQTAANRGALLGLRPRDLALTGGVVLVLATLVIPLPTWALDILLALNLSVALVILLVALSMKEALEFSTFPSVLLFSALFRLSLNVASTRLILLQGDAGKTIEAFGSFVVGGEVAVGLVIFLILVVIQFVVITKGAGRISEVAARFTLDAMPGKQMSIDADLNAGLVTEEEARDRRRRITAEADFYGAMDGASKFVRGDAIAGLIITAINIVGGLIIGVQGGMEIVEAIRKYTILTIGDGLVSQIPALILATSGGIIVTKASSESQLADELVQQFRAKPQALGAASGLMLAMGLVPGFPALPFFALSATLFGLHRVARRSAAKQTGKERLSPEAPSAPDDVGDALAVDRISIEVGYRLIPLVQGSNEGLIAQIGRVRREFARTLGLVVPPIRVKDNVQLEPSTYSILLAEHEVARGAVMVDHYLALDPGLADGPIPGVDTVDPVFGLPAKWVTAAHRAEAEFLNYTVIDSPSVVVTHLKEIIRLHAHELLSLDDVSALTDGLKGRSPATVEELTPKLLSLAEVHRVLRSLLREGVSIRNLQAIYEALAESAPRDKAPESLTEAVRGAISRALIESHLDRSGKLRVITLQPDLEAQLVQSLSPTEAAPPPLPADLLQRLSSEAQRLASAAVQAGHDAVLVTRPQIRRFVSEVLAGGIPRIPVLSYVEIAQVKKIESIGVVRGAEAPAGAPVGTQAAGLRERR